MPIQKETTMLSGQLSSVCHISWVWAGIYSIKEPYWLPHSMNKETCKADILKISLLKPSWTPAVQ